MILVSENSSGWPVGSLKLSLLVLGGITVPPICGMKMCAFCTTGVDGSSQPLLQMPILMQDGTQDVDVRGPCGMTPLMVAAVRGGGMDTGEDEEEDGTAAVIADLVAQGAKLNATMDKTGETSLHLAARYARADAAKRLLDAGADANSQDNTGRTPLHAAVAADAMGVFQVS